MYVTACDLGKSFSLNELVEISSPVYFSNLLVKISWLIQNTMLYFPRYVIKKDFKELK